jgi:VWFA-related protein
MRRPRAATPRPRTTARAAALIATLVAAARPAASPQAQHPRFAERVDVTRVLVDVRVIDGEGRPIRDLESADFLVKIDGRPARVESAVWSAAPSGGTPAADAPSPLAATPYAGLIAPAATARLIVFLFQKDLEPTRIVGFLRLLMETRRWLDTLGPHDRVAVVSFDAHLKVWIDFTNDRDRLQAILARGLLFARPGEVERAAGPSLVARLSPARGRTIYSMERALLAIADALEPLPGAKTLVLVGHGWGQWSGSFLHVDRAYGPAIEAFQAGRVSVFTLDTTDADFHTLEAGLIHVAEATGGFFARTHLFSQRALDRLAGALAGHYVLFVENPSTHKGYHRLEVSLVRRHGTVLAKRGFFG